MTLQTYSVLTWNDPSPSGCYNYTVVIRKSLHAPLPRSAGVTPRPLTPCETYSSAAFKPQCSVSQSFLAEFCFSKTN